MSYDYEFVLPWPPSVNSWKTPWRGRMLLSKRGRAYRENVIELMKHFDLYDERIDKDVTFTMTLNPPTLRRYDVDNFTKSVFDALTASQFWIDDDQVQKLTVSKGCKVKGGNVEIKIKIL